MTGKCAFVNPALVSKTVMGDASKESRSRVIVNRMMNANHDMYVNLSTDNLCKIL